MTAHKISGDLHVINQGDVPIVSIGMPVYNGELTLARAIDSVLSQSLTNFELFISDNCSTDGTRAICEAYASSDRRVRFYSQAQNVGPQANFEFVRGMATAKYFMWAAADDIRPPDFLAVNVTFLEARPDYVASTSPHVTEGQAVNEQNIVRFDATGSVDERFAAYFAWTVTAGRRYRNCWKSHGVFYAVMRRDVLLQAPPLGHFLAWDWAFGLYLLSRGNVHRTNSLPVIFGANGLSSNASIYARQRTRWMEILLPFYVVSAYALSLAKSWPLPARVRLAVVLADVNLRTTYGRVGSWIRTQTGADVACERIDQHR